MKREDLVRLQKLSLDEKIKYSKHLIRDWYEAWEGDVFVAFSGGKDSTVLLHLVRSLYPDVEAVFINTGLEFPEIVKFVKTIDNTTIIKPKHTFRKIIEDYGYPVVSKEVSGHIYEVRNSNSEKLRNYRMVGAPNKWRSGRIPVKYRYLIYAPFKISNKCCYHFKKSPSRTFSINTGKLPMLGLTASDSKGREQGFLRKGCNAFDVKFDQKYYVTHPKSNPIGVWKEKDIWNYIKKYNLDYCSIYDMGYKRTGCIFCMFGIQFESYPNRFQLLQKTHPKLWNYCMEKLGIRNVLDYMKIEYKMRSSLW